MELSKTNAEIARELPCDYHTAHRLVWTIREQQTRLEEGRLLTGTVEVDEIYQTTGHKGRPPKGLPAQGERGRAFSGTSAPSKGQEKAAGARFGGQKLSGLDRDGKP